MSTKTRATLPSHVLLGILDQHAFRINLINRFARIMHGNIAHGLNGRSLSISRAFVGITFLCLIGREHLKYHLKRAIEDYQTIRKGER